MFRSAWPAPGRPKYDQRIFSPELFCVYLLTAAVLQYDIIKGNSNSTVLGFVQLVKQSCYTFRFKRFIKGCIYKSTELFHLRIKKGGCLRQKIWAYFAFRMIFYK